jgi:alanyl-tRNA synthetase
MAYRVVADHIRTLTFAITDGAVPSNDGRGYVLRRILRRAVRYGQEILGAPAGFFTSLVPVVVTNFSDAFPELRVKQEAVRNVINDEEQSFLRTLDQGIKQFKKVVVQMEASGANVVPAKEAHRLFTSMGFPLDLTELMAAERGYSVDTAGFEVLMENERLLSSAAQKKGSGDVDLSMESEQTAWLQSSGVPITDSAGKYTWHHTPSAKVLAIYLGRGGQTAGFVDTLEASNASTIGLVLSVTSFYYESGGQIYDTGVLTLSNGSVFAVESVQTYAGYVVHVGTFQSGSITVGDDLTLSVDYDRRALIAPNHTMTHVLNYALKSVLIGDSTSSAEALQGMVDQKGSFVDADKLRFDFSWNGALSVSQIARVETIVNERIRAELPVYAEVVPLAEASQISALRCVFGERYPDPVRVISVGQSVQALIADPKNAAWNDLSIEFCGGTHLSNTKDAEDFVLYEESGIAKGIRRISGFTRAGARQARAVAADIIAKLTALESLPGGPELAEASRGIKAQVIIISVMHGRECVRAVNPCIFLYTHVRSLSMFKCSDIILVWCGGLLM